MTATRRLPETQTMLRAYPTVRADRWRFRRRRCPARPKRCVRPAARDVSVIGLLAARTLNKPHVHDGVVQTVVLWNTKDLGYLTVRRCPAGATARWRPAHGQWIRAGLGRWRSATVDIILGAPLLITKANIDTFDF